MSYGIYLLCKVSSSPLCSLPLIRHHLPEDLLLGSACLPHGTPINTLRSPAYRLAIQISGQYLARMRMDNLPCAVVTGDVVREAVQVIGFISTMLRIIIIVLFTSAIIFHSHEEISFDGKECTPFPKPTQLQELIEHVKKQFQLQHKVNSCFVIVSFTPAHILCRSLI